jgi:hypothetical protein
MKLVNMTGRTHTKNLSSVVFILSYSYIVGHQLR